MIAAFRAELIFGAMILTPQWYAPTEIMATVSLSMWMQTLAVPVLVGTHAM
jgi:hypothetical protein